MTALFVVRHPQTTWNLAERYQGRLEAPWSDLGARQAQAVAQAFSGQRIDAVYSSPLRRALDLGTQIAAAAGVTVQTDQRLTEIAMGPWEGLYRAEIEARFPALYREWYEHPERTSFPGGEGLNDVAARVSGALSEIFARHPADNVVLTTHSVVVQVIVMLTIRLGFEHNHRVRISNASITTICGIEAPGALLSLNVTEHLYGSTVAAADEQNCVSWKERRMTV